MSVSDSLLPLRMTGGTSRKKAFAYGTLMFALGFSLMMILDVALG